MKNSRGLDPIEVDIQRPDGWHRVLIDFEGGSVGAIETAQEIEGSACWGGSEGAANPAWVEISPPHPFDLTTAEEDYFADKFLTQLAEDAADRRAEMRGEKWG